MNNRHAVHIQRLFDAVHSSPGETDPGFRRAIEERSEALSIRASETMQDIPLELANYVNKVALSLIACRCAQFLCTAAASPGNKGQYIAGTWL
jgi:hypothetical protein